MWLIIGGTFIAVVLTLLMVELMLKYDKAVESLQQEIKETKEYVELDVQALSDVVHVPNTDNLERNVEKINKRIQQSRRNEQHTKNFKYN